MTSASYPVSSTPASSHHSFLVHLQSLLGFRQELQTQVEGIGRPADTITSMTTDPPAFGPFAEATTLTQWSQDAVAHMQGLVSDVKSAMQFADEVTNTVATGYEQADDDVAWGLGGRAPVGTIVGVATGTVGAATGAVGSLTAGLTHTVDGVGHAVDGVVNGVGHAVEGVVDGVGQTVQHTTGAILGALTGQGQPSGGAGLGGLL